MNAPVGGGPMPYLSTPISEIQPHYDVVVVGSGYGGSIAASRMARAGQSVCLLERGKEFQPGEYPDTAEEAMGEMQFHFPSGEIPKGYPGARNGLYDFHFHEDIHVF